MKLEHINYNHYWYKSYCVPLCHHKLKAATCTSENDNEALEPNAGAAAPNDQAAPNDDASATDDPPTKDQPNNEGDKVDNHDDNPNEEQDNPDGEDDDNEIVCTLCNHAPCWLMETTDVTGVFLPIQTLREHLNDIGSAMQQEEKNGCQIRFAMYRYSTRFIHGPLGVHNRRKLPECVVHALMTMFPNADGEAYVGYKEA